MKRNIFKLVLGFILFGLIVQPVSVSGGEEYYDFESKINIVKERGKELGIKKSELIACDTHLDRFKELSEASPMRCQLMNYVNKKLECDFAVIMGDYISEKGKEDKNTLEDKYKTYRQLLAPNTLIIKGNHDDTSQDNGKDASKVASTATLWKYAMEGKKGIKINYRDPMGFYYYKDDIENKIRHIFLNTVDIPYKDEGTNDYSANETCGFRERQLDWFANVALIVPESWQVCIYSHHDMKDETKIINRDVALKIIQDFKNGKVTKEVKSSTSGGDKTFECNISTNFKNQGPKKIIAWFYGHNHMDSYDKIDDINHIGLAAMRFFNDDIDKEIGRTGEGKEMLAFDVMQIDKNNSKLYLTRFGFGKDREFEY